MRDFKKNRKAMLEVKRKAFGIVRREFKKMKIHPGRILEIGTGTGEYTRVLAETFPFSEIISIDIRTGLGKRLVKFGQEFRSNVKFLFSDGVKPGFKRETFMGKQPFGNPVTAC